MKTENIVLVVGVAAAAFLLIKSQRGSAAPMATGSAATGSNPASSGPSASSMSAWLAAGLYAMKNASMAAMGAGTADPSQPPAADYGPYITQYDGVTVGNTWADMATFTMGGNASSSVPLTTYTLP